MTNEQICVFIAGGESDELIPLLWDKTKKLCYKIAGNHFNKHTERAASCGVEFADVRQECYFAFLAALKDYNKEPREEKFTTFLRFPVHTAVNELLGYRVNKHEPLNNCRSLDEPLPGYEDDNVTILDSVVDETSILPFEEVDTQDTYRIINKAVEQLNGQQREVIQARYYENKSAETISELLGVGVKRVHQIRRKAMASLRRMKEIKKLGDDFYYWKGGYSSFRRLGASAVELSAERREEQYARRQEDVIEYFISLGYSREAALELVAL